MSDSIREKIRNHYRDHYFDRPSGNHTDKDNINNCFYCLDKLTALIDQEKRQYVKQVLPEKLDLTVEYQDGTNSGPLPYRRGFNEVIDQTIRNMEAKDDDKKSLA